MKITITAVSVPALRQIQAFRKRYEQQYPEDDLTIVCFYVAGQEQRYVLEPERIIQDIATADVAVVDTMGASEELQEIVAKGLKACKGHRIVIGNALRDYIRLGSFSMGAMGKMMKGSGGKKDPGNVSGTSGTDSAEVSGTGEKKSSASALTKMHRMRRMAMMMGNVLPFGVTRDMKNVFLLIDYWQQATRTDMESFMHLILRQYGGRKFLPKEKPCTMEYGVYLKDPFSMETWDTPAKFWKKADFDSQRETVALLFYGHSYPNDFLPVVQALAEKLGERYNLLPIAFSQNEDGDLKKLRAFLTQKKTPVSAVVNLMPFRLGAGPMGGDAVQAVEILKELDVPYFKPFCLTRVSGEEWERADAVNPGEFLISILLPELDGGILTFPVGVMGSGSTEGEEPVFPQLEPIAERVDTFVARLSRMLELRKKKREEKRLAVIFYNYPPGESNVFGGAFLDTFASASRLLEGLKEAGYDTEGRSPEELQEVFVTGGHCNLPQWCEEEEDGITWECEGEEYPIRGIGVGHVFLGLQPLRDPEGESGDPGRYHDRNRKPSGEYQAFYHWIREGFQADAMIHFGTHGTLEFLPGKDNGMTGSCWPDQLVGEIPHFYYYYIGNPSEAMIAKRRSLATLVSYQAPELKKSGLYGDYQELREMIGEYRESIQSAPERCGDLLLNIAKAGKSCGFLEGDSGENCSEKDLDLLEERLYEYENSLITDGLHEINETELNGLVHGLDGGYVPVGTAGDVVKNPSILPSGRNLVQFDPRLVPTRTACERGMKAAQLSVEAYHEKMGTYPDTTALILWGLETSRSQGETIGQILYYLGIRLKTEKSSYDDRLEVIPTEELDRPRMDVVIHICGFFRDMYPNLIDNLNAMLRQILRLEEGPEKSYFTANTRKMAEELQRFHPEMEEREAWDLASCRIFGPKEGEYGTRLTDVVRKGSWKDAAEIGSSFTEDLSYGYSFRRRGVKAEEVLAEQYDHVDFISQVRNNVEYELTDLDHYYEFYGGLARAVENKKGSKPVMLVADTTGEAVKVQDLKSSLERGIATRLLNPEWIQGMMRHDYHGVQQIAKRFENVMGFAASTDAVTGETFSRMTRCYAGDEKLRKQMQQSNKWAYMKMMERLMEASNRGYFEATEEELSQIREAYLEAEGEAEE